MTDDVEDQREIGVGWRLLAAGTTGLMILVGVIVQVTQQAVIPPVAVLMAVFLVGAVLVVTRPRAGVITVGVAAVVMVLANLPFVLDDLTHPESFWNFLPSAAGLIGGLVGVALLIGGLRRADDAPAGYVGAVAIAGVVAVLALAIVSSGGYEDDAKQPGDFALFAQDIQFKPDTIDAPAGEIGVFIVQDDLVRHNFSIDELDVDEELPSKAYVRFAFEAEAGTYEFYCDIPGHEDMKGTLTVT